MANSLNATTPQLKVVDRFFAAYRTQDLQNVAPILSKNYMYKPFPKVPGLGDMTKEEHLALFGPLFAKPIKHEHIFHEVIEAEAPGKVVIQWTSVFTLRDGPVFEYDSVSIIDLVEEDGELKVLGFLDFADPDKRSYFHKTLSDKSQIA